MKIDTCFLIGLGGIGSCLVDSLCRLLMHHKNGTCDISISDGQTYEPSNMTRQLCFPDDMGKNKAVAIADRMSAFPNLLVVDEFLRPENFPQMVMDLPLNQLHLFVMAVDVDASRRLVLDTIAVLDNYIFINAANGYSEAQCSLHIRLNGKDLTVHPFDRYENINKPSDVLPGGCAAETPSVPQLLVANAAAAHSALLMTYCLLEDLPVPDEIYTDLFKFRSKGLGINKYTKAE